MKRQFSFLGMLQPLYVVVASTIGIAAAKTLFMENWASPYWIKEPDGLVQVLVPDFMAFVFVVAILLAFLAIVFMPMWKLLFDLVKETISGLGYFNKLGNIAMLLLGALSFLLVMRVALNISDSIRITPDGTISDELSLRLGVLIVCILVTITPIPLISLLLFGRAYELTEKIPLLEGDEPRLFEIAYQLLRYRNLLQNSLLVIGIIVSAVPIVTALLRSAIIELDKTETVATMWPMIYPIMYGLLFTTVLLLFYAPTHLMLTQAGQKLRDELCPIHDLSDMDKNMKRRRDLDEWLQINLSLAQNLKAGIITLAPLITSFVTSIPGLKIF